MSRCSATVGRHQRFELLHLLVLRTGRLSANRFQVTESLQLLCDPIYVPTCGYRRKVLTSINTSCTHTFFILEFSYGMPLMSHTVCITKYYMVFCIYGIVNNFNLILTVLIVPWKDTFDLRGVDESSPIFFTGDTGILNACSAAHSTAVGMSMGRCL